MNETTETIGERDVDERARLLRAYLDLARRLDRSPNPSDRLDARVDEAWAELADWKEDHAECLQPACSAVTTDLAYCGRHR